MNNSKELAIRFEKLTREIYPKTLIAVTKYSSIDEVLMAYSIGLKDFGENRVYDLKEKADAFHNEGITDVRWHFIGHLQRNKVRDLLKIPNLYAIHSIDSLKLLQELVSGQSLLNQPLKIFFQIHISGEEEKTGFPIGDGTLDEAVNFYMALKNTHPQFPFSLEGLMGMGPIRTEDFEGDTIRAFSKLFELRNSMVEQYKIPLKLSMGMSQDYKIALEFDADYLRLGSILFKN